MVIVYRGQRLHWFHAARYSICTPRYSRDSTQVSPGSRLVNKAPAAEQSHHSYPRTEVNSFGNILTAVTGQRGSLASRQDYKVAYG